MIVAIVMTLMTLRQEVISQSFSWAYKTGEVCPEMNKAESPKECAVPFVLSADPCKTS